MSEQELQNKVYIVINASMFTYEQEILGVYSNKEKAKIKVADFVLSQSMEDTYLFIEEQEIK